jgi:hypothetical protein
MMRQMRSALALVALASMLSGCLTGRAIARVEDHPEKNITIMETVDTFSYLIYGEMVHQFWQCEQTGKKLVCSPICGPKTDVQCPNVVWGGQTGSSNVR